MATRWILALALVACTGPASAQVDHDAENPDIVLSDPVWVTKPAVPISQLNAETAAVSPSKDTAPKIARATPKKPDCTKTDACALATPESR